MVLHTSGLVGNPPPTIHINPGPAHTHRAAECAHSHMCTHTERKRDDIWEDTFRLENWMFFFLGCLLLTGNCSTGPLMLTGFPAGDEGDSFTHGIACCTESGLLVPPPLLQLHSLANFLWPWGNRTVMVGHQEVYLGCLISALEKRDVLRKRGEGGRRE